MARKYRKSRKSRARRGHRRVTRRARRTGRGHSKQNRKFAAAAKACERMFKEGKRTFSFKNLGSCMRSEMK